MSNLRIATSRTAYVLCALIVLACQAKADVITYDLTGTFQDGQTLSGTIGIDSLLDLPVSMDVTVTAPAQVYSFSYLNSEFGIYNNAFGYVQNYNPGGEEVYVLLGATWSSLVDTPMTIPLVSESYNPYSQSPSNFIIPPSYFANLETGQASPAATPEPATITLLASGFFAAGGFGVYRRRRGRAESSPAC